MLVKVCLSAVFILLHLVNTVIVINTLIKVFKKKAETKSLIRNLIIIILLSLIAFVIKVIGIVGFSGVITDEDNAFSPEDYMVYYTPIVEKVFLSINFIGIIVALICNSIIKKKQKNTEI